MKIAEMEAHHVAFVALENTVGRMVKNNEFPAVFARCEDSYPHVVPALKFRKKRNIVPEMPAFVAFEIVCGYAPILFEHGVLESFMKFVQSTRELKKHENGFLDMAEIALSCEEAARKLWNCIEQRPGIMQRDIGKETNTDHKMAVDLVTTWEHLGVIIRSPGSGSYALQLRTQLDARMEGFCQNCEVRGEGRKERFFQVVSCGKCGVEDYFHLNYPQ